MQVEHHDEVERRPLGLELDEIGTDEAGSDPLAVRTRLRLVDRDLGVVDAEDVPAERGEPDRVLPLAARQVECAPGLEVLHLGNEKAVRLRGPQVLDGRVPRVPVLTPHGA